MLAACRNNVIESRTIEDLHVNNDLATVNVLENCMVQTYSTASLASRD
jgi:hypothetical protein